MALDNVYLEQLKQKIASNLARLTAPTPINVSGDLTLQNGYISADQYIVNGQNLSQLIKGDRSISRESLVDIIKLGQIHIENITSKAGRKLYRHPSGMGTVIEFTDTAARKVLVLDAKYRTSGLKMSTAVGDGTTSTTTIVNTSLDVYPNQCQLIADDLLNDNNWEDAKTSKQNTDTWLQQSGCEVARYVRSVKVDGVGCDIPNYQTLLRIFCEGYLLDAMDPTSSAYPHLSLSMWFGDSFAWSSSEVEFDVDGSGSIIKGVQCLSAFDNSYTNKQYFVVPVLEL